MATIRLNSGSLLSEKHDGEIPSALERKARLVYEGTFDSMDGEVEVTNEDLQRLVDNHNSLFSKLKRMALQGDVPVAHCPPMQLDHSTSARDTVGRVIGELSLGDYTDEDGTAKKAVFGVVRFLGKENVEKAIDGRWAQLSVGADFAAGKLSELSVTPFPAAANASLLSKKIKLAEGEDMNDKLKKHLMENCKMSAEEADKAIGHMRKHLMDADKSDEKAADEKLSKATDDEVKEHLARYTKHLEDEKTKDTDKAKIQMSRLAALKVKSTELLAKSEGTTLASARVAINSRLTRLKASAKITPAEMKKIDIDHLAKSEDKVVDAVLKSYEDREPVIMTGLTGTTKATNITMMKKAEMENLEREMRANMSLKKLQAEHEAEDGSPSKKLEEGKAAEAKIDMTPHMAIKNHMSHLLKLLEEGKIDDAKAHMQKLADGAEVETPAASEEAEKELSALRKEIVNLRGEIVEMSKLIDEVSAGTV